MIPEDTADPSLIENRIATEEAPQFLSARDLAARLAIDLKKVYRMADTGELPGLKVGKSWRFIWSDVLSSIKKRSCYGNQG